MSHALTLLVAGDPGQRTGGYLYDAHIVNALRHAGHRVEVVGLEGRFPDVDREAETQLSASLARLTEGASVVIDGLAMGALPDVVAKHSDRLDITALLHHPLGDEEGMDATTQQRLHQLELRGLQSAARVIVTSHFTAQRLAALAEQYDVALEAPVVVVEPGVEAAAASPAPSQGGPVRLLCIATLIPRKGQDILVRALAGMAQAEWQCDCYGGLRDIAFAERVKALIDRHGLAGRVVLHGECDAATLEAAYQQAHALVLPSWYEGYGMVVSEALAHGLPVITTTGGALKDTLPVGAGLHVPPGDADALRQALERFCGDDALRCELRDGALLAREQLNDWQAAGAAFAAALADPPAAPQASDRFAADWLSLRESVDATSRSAALAERAAQWLAARTSAPCIADLGCGRGSNGQFLAPRLSGSQRWQLLDHDPGLLEEAQSRVAALQSADRQPVIAEAHCVSLAALSHPALCDAQLVTASALLDLVSQAWLEALVAQCARRHQALLIALSVTGEWGFLDARGEEQIDDEDRWLMALFNAHQQRDKGLGEALGGLAQPVLVDSLMAHGYAVEQVASPWLIAAGDVANYPLMAALVDGWALAATEQAPEASRRIDAWREAMQRRIEAGEQGLWVGHQDLLALPAETV